MNLISHKGFTNMKYYFYITARHKTNANYGDLMSDKV